MDKIRLGITHGDINGIGYEIIIKTLKDSRITDFCTPILYGSPKVAAYHRKAIDISNFSLNHINDATEANSKRTNVINVIEDNIRVELGKSTNEAGEASFLALEQAVNDIQIGKIDALLTAPINKQNIQSKNFDFKGHTEYFAEKFQAGNYLMLMVGEDMKVGVVTSHIPLSEIPENITEEKILNKLSVLNKSLKEDFGINKPKIGVLGLNPHVGDEGLLGKEEEEIIKPAINKAREDNIEALGPYPADGFFGQAAYKHFDAVLAMYHDQGLAPFKALSNDGGVNYTAGLPIIRTSPDHGTAYEIAGDGKASPEAFRKALYLAVDIYKTRTQEKELKKNSAEIEEEDDN